MRSQNTMTAATAATGAVSGAAALSGATVLFSDLLINLTDRLLLNVVEERAAGMSVRPEDKEWIARVYAYILIGVMLDWIAGEMQEDPTVLVHRLAMVIHGNVTSALGRFEANGGLLSKQSE